MSELGSPPLAPLSAVEWRVDGQPIERNGGWVCRFVPYLDASTIADLLDEWVGHRWSDEYVPGTIGGKEVLWCHLSIEVEPGQWVTRRDVGKPTAFEGEKGAVSDAFKRAGCLKWGVGRNVYDLPGDLWAPCRTYTNAKGTHAAANKDSLPSLLAQLKDRGYDDADGRVVEVPEGVDPTTGEVGVTAEQIEPVKKVLNDLGKQGRTAWLAEFGCKPDELPQARLDEAVAFVADLAEQMAGEPEPGA